MHARRLRTLDAAALLERGLDAYDRLEYSAALRAFMAASEQDARNPVIAAWRSRTAMLMRRDTEAADSRGTGGGHGRHDQLPEADRWFVDAVVNEARRDFWSSGRQLPR